MRSLFAAISGALFGLGLMVSGMTDTTKVQGWLDLFGDWDPTLAFVLGGAILPMTIAWAALSRRKTGFLGSPLPAQPRNEIDRAARVGRGTFWSGMGVGRPLPRTGAGLAVMGRTARRDLHDLDGRGHVDRGAGRKTRDQSDHRLNPKAGTRLRLPREPRRLRPLSQPE